MKRIGLLGGSFDPVHLGHLNLAIAIQELCFLDEVLIIPAGVSPFKQNAPPIATPEHRLAMLQLAISQVPNFRIIDWELKASGPSYTIETVRRIAQENDCQLFLLLGEDHLPTFQHWKEVEKLTELAPLLVGTRGEKGAVESYPQVFGGKRVQIPVFEISSTWIRQRLSEKKYCGHLLPAAVLDYILKHRLYKK